MSMINDFGKNGFTVAIGIILTVNLFFSDAQAGNNTSCDQGYAEAVRENYSAALNAWSKGSIDNSPKEKLRATLTCIKAVGIANDDAEAADWIIRAAEHGIARAQTYTGMLYASGTGVTQDITKARIWFKRANDNGDECALLLMQLMETE